MRENHTYGLHGGEAKTLPAPYRIVQCFPKRALLPDTI